jgi:hypothetical protein
MFLQASKGMLVGNAERGSTSRFAPLFLGSEIKESNFVWRYVTYVRNVGSGVFSSGTKAYPVP